MEGSEGRTEGTHRRTNTIRVQCLRHVECLYQIFLVNFELDLPRVILPQHWDVDHHTPMQIVRKERGGCTHAHTHTHTHAMPPVCL